MGRVKSTLIKRTAAQLMDGNKDNFTKDFYNNKKVLKGTMPSKSIHNKVAGHITRLVRQQEVEEKDGRKKHSVE